jgi:hypothetical protein
MRAEPNVRLEQCRIAGPPNTNCGNFRVGPLVFVVSDGAGWDHVSVSARGRVPTWEEMDRVKGLVFRDDEVVMQLHINGHQKINVCQYCLHLWRPQTAEEIAAIRQRWEASGEAWPYGMESAGAIPLPPRDLV